MPRSILRKSSTINDLDFIQEKRSERQSEITKNKELKKAINFEIDEMAAIVKSKKVDFYPLNSTLNDSLAEMDCREDSGLNRNNEFIQRDLTDFERISANTLLLTHNLNFLRERNQDMNVKMINKKKS
jgi:hypothetical protein